MSTTQAGGHIQSSPAPKPPAAGPGPVRKPQPVPKPLWVRVLAPLASLRLTVVLFVLSFILVFFGTLAQIDHGIWTVMAKYFRSFYVWIPFQLTVQFLQTFFFVPRSVRIDGSFPFPGGWVIGGALLLNLLAAHLVRFKLSWKRTGILVTHFGIILLLIGELVTGTMSFEGAMLIREGGTSNYVADSRSYEVAVIDRTDAKTDAVVAVPDALLRSKGTVAPDGLPFDLTLVEYMHNSKVEDIPSPGHRATKGTGRMFRAVPLPEVSGTSSDDVDQPAAYVTLRDRAGGGDVGAYLLHAGFVGQRFEHGGRTYEIALRPTHHYRPFSVTLLEARHDVYMGTDKPKNFSSRVRLVDPEANVDREVTISMNAPLRYRGETFYQSRMITDSPTTKTTGLQVVRNPGWVLPYVSCTLVSLGLLIHFGISLVNFQQRRAAR